MPILSVVCSYALPVCVCVCISRSLYLSSSFFPIICALSLLHCLSLTFSLSFLPYFSANLIHILLLFLLSSAPRLITPESSRYFRSPHSAVVALLRHKRLRLPLAVCCVHVKSCFLQPIKQLVQVGFILIKGMKRGTWFSCFSSIV